jgi:sugar/nucleoside kinase (ribokinase family)
MGRLLCLGDLNVDLAITLRHELANGSDTDGTVKMTGGGSAANVAAWAVAAGVGTRFVGPVGDDDLGDYLIHELESHDVDVQAVIRLGQSTRSVAVIVGPDGNRSLVSDQQNVIALDEDDLDLGWFDDVDWLHLTAYTYIVPRSRALFGRLTEIADFRHIPYSIDPSAAELLRSNCNVADVLDAFSGAAVLFPSHDEAEHLTGLSDPVAAANRLLDVASCVAVTLGADGAYVVNRNGDSLAVPAGTTELVNTLGCGDAFVGGFLSAAMAGADIVACTERAIGSASRATTIASAR